MSLIDFTFDSGDEGTIITFCRDGNPEKIYKIIVAWLNKAT